MLLDHVAWVAPGGRLGSAVWLGGGGVGGWVVGAVGCGVGVVGGWGGGCRAVCVTLYCLTHTHTSTHRKQKGQGSGCGNDRDRTPGKDLCH